MDPNLLAEIISEEAADQAEIAAGLHSARVSMQTRVAADIQSKLGISTEKSFTVAGESLNGFVDALIDLLIRHGADRVDVPKIMHAAFASETARENFAGQVTEWLVSTKQVVDLQRKREAAFIATEPSLHKV